MQQRLVAAREAHHRLVDGGVAVRIQLHRLADDVGALGALSREQPHLVHGVEQLAVRGLEAVDLGDGARDDDAHGIGHVVLLDDVGDELGCRGGGGFGRAPVAVEVLCFCLGHFQSSLLWYRYAFRTLPQRSVTPSAQSVFSAFCVK